MTVLLCVFVNTQAAKGSGEMMIADSVIIADSSFKENDEVIASWYGPGFHGKKTASGERYDMNALTAAHKTLPFGTKVKITNVKNGKSVVVTINDRGPYVKNRKFDLSKAAFHKIAKRGTGVIKVTYEILK